jgi:hypothetical protein
VIDDMQLIEAAQRAERIKAVMPHLAVSTDALFAAIILGKRRPGRPGMNRKIVVPTDPPEWFTTALAGLKGQTMTIGKFVMLAGKFPCTTQEKVAVGRWLRASGRKPRKCSGKQLFDI